jgi:hypothetical protein
LVAGFAAAAGAATDAGAVSGAGTAAGAGDAAGGLEGRAFGRVADAHAKGAAVAEGVLDHLPQVGVVDDEIKDPRCGEALDVPDDQRLAAGRQQRLGAAVGERAHAFAAAGGEDHGFHGAQKE